MAKIVVSNLAVSQFPQAIHGMRNPLESWEKSDSVVVCYDKATKGLIEIPLKEYNASVHGKDIDFILGEVDKDLALRLIKAGTDHCKFMRQISIIADISAPMTWWWDTDTYMVGVTKNSTSRMHKLGSRLLTMDDFGCDGSTTFREDMLKDLNARIQEWQKRRKDKNDDPEVVKLLWRGIVDDLPQSFMFLRTWSANYQVLRNLYYSRKGHKQVEFDQFRLDTIENLPYSELITTF